MRSSINQMIKRALAKVRRQELVQLTCQLVNIPSRTGEEGDCAKFLVDYMRQAGLETSYQEINHKRGNAVGLLPGSGGGPTLIFNGHLDTSFTGVEDEDYPATGPLSPGSLPVARVEAGNIYGLGVYNMKAGLAASVIAVKAIKQAGIIPKGNIVLTGVAGEVEKTPVRGAVRSYHGQNFVGGSIGTEWLIKHGLVADFVINEEPTDLKINWENGGYCWLKVKTKGTATYVTRKRFAVNSILEMMKVAQAIEEWAPEYSEAHRSGSIRPEVMIGAIESGWPYKPSTCPAICNLYVDVRTSPGQDPRTAIHEFGSVIERLKAKHPELKVDFEPYLLDKGYRTDPDSPFVKRCIGAYETVMGRKHEDCTGEHKSSWTDCNVFRRYGIPAISCGPGTGYRRKSRQITGIQYAQGEDQRITDLVLAAKIYIVASLGICLRSS